MHTGIKQDHMSKSYLIFKVFISIAFLGNIATSQDLNVSSKDSNKVYSGKPLLASLLLPGSGQLINKDPIWKPMIFGGIELITLFSIFHSNNQAERIRNKYQDFANENWNISNWWSFVDNGATLQSVNGKFFGDEDLRAMRDHVGTHHLTFFLKGDLVNLFNNTKYVSSDSLGLLSSYINSGDVEVVKDRHFYENIGKYDQFVGGWSDASNSWYWEEKDVGDSIEIVIKTPKKQDFLEQRYDSNQWLNFAKFSISALMFNHVISGLEAVWTSQRKTVKTNEDIDVSIGLNYDPKNKFGIGGLNFNVSF